LSLEELWRRAHEKKSRLIIALDMIGYSNQEFEEKVNLLMNTLRELVCGIKIGLPMLITKGPEYIRQLIARYKNEYYFIADLKLADVPHINEYVLHNIKEMGFNAAITHLFQGGLRGLVKLADEIGVDIIGIVMMSHEGSVLFVKVFNELLEYAKLLKVDGVVVGATKPAYIIKAREILNKDIAIFSPGIIYQGAEPGQAIRAGADFEIIGRAIVNSKNPLKIAKEVVLAEREALYG